MTAYRMAAGVPLIVVRDRAGILHHHYNPEQPGVARGPHIPWLDDEQRAHFLRHKLVEVVEDSGAPVEPADEGESGTEAVPGDPESQAGAIDECVATLENLAVPPEAGAPTARERLRTEGHRYSNETIAAAVKHRRLSGTAEL